MERQELKQMQKEIQQKKSPDYWMIHLFRNRIYLNFQNRDYNKMKKI